MAETKKKSTETSEEMVTIRLPRDPDPRHPQQEFFSLNFKNYIIKRGVPVEVPKAVAELIQNKYDAEDYIRDYDEYLKYKGKGIK